MDIVFSLIPRLFSTPQPCLHKPLHVPASLRQLAATGVKPAWFCGSIRKTTWSHLKLHLPMQSLSKRRSFNLHLVLLVRTVNLFRKKDAIYWASSETLKSRAWTCIGILMYSVPLHILMEWGNMGQNLGWTSTIDKAHWENVYEGSTATSQMPYLLTQESQFHFWKRAHG